MKYDFSSSLRAMPKRPSKSLTAGEERFRPGRPRHYCKPTIWPSGLSSSIIITPSLSTLNSARNSSLQ